MACGLEGFYGDEIAGIALEQDFAAQEMREWEIAMTFDLVCEGQCLFDAREGAASPKRLGVELREPGDHGPIAAK